ncbi:hypothetical protein DPMN_034566 [Dreissena polymorpha]|uniref:Uncharacterized protein n=1 Tax=Dreissena polymorpha TaxID=45954 RepID=A0A9D4RM41_DREPO|nr:hypothetical protein DPMN_034566 [Dreissena polymorpha]
MYHHFLQKVSGKDESQYSNSTTNLLLIVLSAASSAANAVIYVIFNCGLREACRTICCTFAAKWRKKINGRNVKITV